MNIKDFSAKFKELVGNTCKVVEKTDKYPGSIIASPWNKNPHFYYLLKQDCADGEVGLEFWIDRAHYWEYAKEVECLTTSLSVPTNQRDAYLLSYYSSQGCRMRRPLESTADLEADFKRLQEIIGNIPAENAQRIPEWDGKAVGVEQMSARKLLRQPLAIPPFQRGYCWRKKDVISFLNSVSRWQKDNTGRNYHMGTIVLRRAGDHWHIIDGLQRTTTLAILQFRLLQLGGVARSGSIPLLEEELRGPNNMPEARNCLLHARDAIRAWGGTIDFERLECGVVELGADTSPDLAYSFFNHINASGVRLSDYDLLKSHHLRFVEGDAMSERMATAWDSELAGSDLKELVLHKLLYRLRKWSVQESFGPADDCSPYHVLFHHFECKYPVLPGLGESSQEGRFDSTIHGGVSFFMFYQRHREAYRQFCAHPAITSLTNWLANHSNNVLHDAIEALAYLFFIKFGGLHLSEAVYCLAFHLSRIRNESRLASSKLSTWPGFSETARLIAQATDTNDVIAALLDEGEYYEAKNTGGRAWRYWEALAYFLSELNGRGLVFLPENSEKRDSSPLNRAKRFAASWEATKASARMKAETAQNH